MPTIALLLLLATAPPSGRATPKPTPWVIRESVSAIDDSKTIVAVLRADSSVRAWPGTRATPELFVRCSKGAFDAFIHLGVAPTKNRTTGTVDMLIRFDKEEARDPGATLSQDGRAVFIPNPVSFIEELRVSDRLALRFTPFNSGPQETTFILRGVEAAVSKLLEACPAPPAQ